MKPLAKKRGVCYCTLLLEQIHEKYLNLGQVFMNIIQLFLNINAKTLDNKY